MATRNLSWVRMQNPFRAEAAADAGLGLESVAEGLAQPAAATIEIPDLTGLQTPIEKARLLLEIAAEVEHALLVQYLYAAYSLRDPNDGEWTPEQKAALRQWRSALRTIALEEMSHLMTVQNLLLFTRLKPHFAREPFPPQEDLFPFTLHLEKLSQESLAKYVVAESPDSSEGIEDIVRQAQGAAGVAINRVGVVYILLGLIFTKEGDLYRNAASGDPWSVMVRDFGHAVFSQFPQHPPSAWHLPDEAFDAGSIARQATDVEWAPDYDNMTVFAVKTRAECLVALRDIGIQGEGLATSANDAVDSHYERFLKMYRGDGTVPPFPAAGGWTPTHDVPRDPVLAPAGTSPAPNLIDHSTAAAWAAEADERYELLLLLLEYYFAAKAEDRPDIVAWCIGTMYQLAALSGVLTELPRSAAGEGKAALPFTLKMAPLPADPEEFRRFVVTRLEAAVQHVKSLRQQFPDSDDLKGIQEADEGLIAKLKGVTPPPLPTPEAAFRQLINDRRSIAKVVHGGIAAGASSLNRLFKDKLDDEILTFLQTGISARDPFIGERLVVPGKPAESALVKQMLEGVMAGHLADEDVEIVRQWIASLAPSEPPPPPPGPTPEEEMITLLREKRSLGRVMHGGVNVGGGQTLNQLFQAENYPAILQFLATGVAARDPATGKRLIVPGKPAESGFYIQITSTDGVMFGRFTPAQKGIVERWIMSLGMAPAGLGLESLEAPPADTAGNAPGRLTLRPVAAGLNAPVFVTAPPGDHQRLFIVEQGGRIRILSLATNQLLPVPFLTTPNITSGGERGLLGLAFHPQFAANGQFFVNCTNSQGHTEIRRYQVSAQDANVADPQSETLVLRVEQPFANHNGGGLHFGPRDGFLYIALGDGGSGNDPGNRAQNTNVLLGKMLRINVDGDDFPNDPSRNYAIPPSNPFRGQPNVREEIWSVGLRNPWRWSFDRQTGDLMIGDVGQNQREEINFQPASSTGGENYGWRFREGTRDTGLGDPGSLQLVPPIHEYGHDQGVAIVGGYVYRGSQFPQLQGLYFFAEFTGRIWSLVIQNGAAQQVTERTAELLPGGGELGPISSFGEDASGELYVASLDGSVSRLEVTPVRAGAALEAASRWDQVASIRIHPAIGIARVGNAGFVSGRPAMPLDPADYFIGPEKPYDVATPAGGYKRGGKIRRQAARFRLYAYDQQNNLIGEITAADADISWSVELANTKASWKQFRGLDSNSPLRNSHIAGANRAGLEIRPGFRTVNGPGQAAAFSNGSFTDFQAGQSRTVSNIYLGSIQADADGRLLVLAGEGAGGSPWMKPITDYANNQGWYDTTADGPVTATVRFRDTDHTVPVRGAWVVCAPPKFAPALRNIVTLRDTLVQAAVTAGRLPAPGQPSFRFDIYPVLERAMRVKWLMETPNDFHDHFTAAFPPAAPPVRRSVVARLRHPHKGQGLNRPRMNMPRLYDDNNDWVPTGDPGLAITSLMYRALERWVNDDFVNDWTGVPPESPATITPAGLDQAALENCAGAAFFPGIEVSWLLRDVYPFFADEPFRLDPATLHAGDLSKQMAVPWQADFYKCTSTSSGIGWWPQQRPDEVFVAGEEAQLSWIRDKINNHLDMVNRWHELGFVQQSGDQFVETDRT